MSLRRPISSVKVFAKPRFSPSPPESYVLAPTPEPMEIVMETKAIEEDSSPSRIEGGSREGR